MSCGANSRATSSALAQQTLAVHMHGLHRALRKEAIREEGSGAPSLSAEQLAAEMGPAFSIDQEIPVQAAAHPSFSGAAHAVAERRFDFRQGKT